MNGTTGLFLEFKQKENQEHGSQNEKHEKRTLRLLPNQDQTVDGALAIAPPMEPQAEWQAHLFLHR